MDINEKKEIISDLNPDALFADGLDDALIGVAQQFNRHLPVYETEKCIKLLIKHGMSRESAEEYFDFNVIGAYVGENTPLFISFFKK